MRRLPPLPIAGIAMAALLSTSVGAAEEFRLVRTVEAAGPEAGPLIAVVLPVRAYETTNGLADQLGLMAPTRGRLVVLEYDAPTTGPLTNAAALKAGLDLDPDHLLVVSEAQAPSGDEQKKRLPHAVSNRPADAARLLSGAIASSFDDDSAPTPTVSSLPGDTSTVPTYYLAYSEDDVPSSRINRWNRLFVHGLLSEEGIAPSRETMAKSLQQRAPNYAMYDCEGVGGRGPVALERIVGTQNLGLTMTRVTPEDIREGALTGFTGVLFPGGGGKTIAVALKPEGQEIVKGFVAEGGGYVGVCAGAYLATCRIDGYLNMVGLYHGQPWLKGGGMVDVELTPEGEKLFGSEYRTFKTRYNNGPIFGHEEGLVPQGDFAEAISLATFRSATKNRQGREATEMIGASAITASSYGQGRCLLISPHPESHEQLYPFVGRGLLWAVRMDGTKDGENPGG